MNFVDRIEETARLRDALSREKSSLVVVYGRRRLGKSTLIKRVLSDSDVYFLADRSEGQHQRILLAKVVAHETETPNPDKSAYQNQEILALPPLRAKFFDVALRNGRQGNIHHCPTRPF